MNGSKFFLSNIPDLFEKFEEIFQKLETFEINPVSKIMCVCAVREREIVLANRKLDK